MDWKRTLIKLHPQNLLDFFVDAVLLLMEIWAVLRVVLILLLVVATIILYAVEGKANEINETTSDSTHITYNF